MGSKSKQPAARLGDIASNHGAWHPSPIIAGSGDVFTNGKPAARKGDAAAPHVKPKSKPHGRNIAEGSGTVFINGKPAARVTDAINCGGDVATGSGDVFIGDDPKLMKPSFVEPVYALRFELKDELGEAIKGIPYRVVRKGLANKEEAHIADDFSAYDGKTPVVSRLKGESFDYHVAWSKVNTQRAKTFQGGHAGRIARQKEQAAIEFEERMQKMLEDGHAGVGHELSYEEAKWWWRNAEGKTLTVDGRVLSSMDVGAEFATPWPLDDLKVHGHVTTNPANGRIYDGMYDFEPRVMPNPNYSPRIAMRNYLNERAIEQHGPGTPFEIQYRYEDSFFP
ncbi:MAG: PAAR domain-containing protein [Cellvibrionaceae bacterium]